MGINRSKIVPRNDPQPKKKPPPLGIITKCIGTSYDVDKTYRIVVVGSNLCGKTSLIHRYVHSEFIDYHVPSFGAECESVHLTDGSQIFQLIVGESNSPSQAHTYRKIDGVVLMYAYNDLSSFTLLSIYLQHIKRLSRCPIILVGNKMDGVSAVSQSDAKHFAVINGLPLIGCCARHNYNVDEVFSRLLQLIYEQ
jgi:small GTP-binding protein